MNQARTREKGGAILQREAQFVNGIHLELDRGHDPEAVHADLADNDRGVDAEDVALNLTGHLEPGSATPFD